MQLGCFTKGPIQIYALPGTENYVKHVVRWLAKDFLNDIHRKNLEVEDYFHMDDIEIEALNKYDGSIEDFLAYYLMGEFVYFLHRSGAIEISIKNSARKRDIYVFHTFSEAEVLDANHKEKLISFSDQEVLLYNTLDAFLEAKVNRVTIFEMNLGQARSDRPKGRGACNLRTFFRNITANGADHFFTFQIHSAKSLIGIDNTRTTYDNFGGQNILIRYILQKYVKSIKYLKEVVANEWIFSSVDAGGKEFAAEFAKSLMTPLLVVDKRRNPITNKIEEITILKPESLNLKDKIIFIVDDMIDSGGSIVDVCRKYKEYGVKEINVACFYGIFSTPAEERLNELVKEGALNKLLITDLVSHSKDFLKRNPFIEVVDTHYSTASIIMKTNLGRSLEKYFLSVNAVDYLKEKVEPLSLKY